MGSNHRSEPSSSSSLRRMRMPISCSLSLLLGFLFLTPLMTASSEEARAAASASPSLSRFRPRASGSDGDKVLLELYYETLCPYCSNFIVNYLPKLFETELISVVDLKLIPYGNARIGANDSISCQHGPAECLLNTVEACAIGIWPKLSDHFRLIYCIENLVYSHEFTQWESCFDQVGLEAKPVADCYAGEQGKELELGYAAQTNALQPPHQYVPWVVVDGKPLYEDYENFMSYICEAYNGTAELSACSDVSLNPIRLKKGYQNLPVCYTKERMLPGAFARAGSAMVLIRRWMQILTEA